MPTCYENSRSRSTPARSSWRSRTRLLAPRVWARRSSVDHRIATHGLCHLHDRPAHDHPAVQSISRRTQPASLRVALALCVGPTGRRLAPPHFRSRGWPGRRPRGLSSSRRRAPERDARRLGPHQIRTRRFPPSGSSAERGSWSYQSWTRIVGVGSGYSCKTPLKRSQLNGLRWPRRLNHFFHARFT